MNLTNEQAQLLSWLREAPRRHVEIQYTPKGNPRKHAYLIEHPAGYQSPPTTAGTVPSAVVLPLVDAWRLRRSGSVVRADLSNAALRYEAPPED